jgi:hypothetical protein
LTFYSLILFLLFAPITFEAHAVGNVAILGNDALIVAAIARRHWNVFRCFRFNVRIGEEEVMDGEKLFLPIGFVAQFAYFYEELFGNVQDFSVTLEPLVWE